MEVQAGMRPFAYSWLLMLTALVALMEPKDYQGMEVDVVKVCKGERYQNISWMKEPERLKDCDV